MRMRMLAAAAAAGVALLSAGSVHQAVAAESGAIKVGMAVALTGYLADIDRALQDGALLAIEQLNAKGGINGRKFEAIVEDMKSEAQASVTAVTKLVNSDQVDILVNGCSSAGNLAVAPLAQRASTPLIICGLLPKDDSPEWKWTFTTLPPFEAEILPRMQYLASSTKVKKIALLYDPTPYSQKLKALALKQAAQNKFEVVADEQFDLKSTDLSVQLKKAAAAGAEAIFKNGIGPTTIIAAKNMKQLGLSMPMLGTIDNLPVSQEAAKQLGSQFYFVAAPVHVHDALPANSPLKAPIGDFLKVWKAKYGDRDGMWAGRGWDAMLLMAEAIKRAGSADGEKVRAAMETINKSNLTGGEYNFSASAHQGIDQNPTVLAQIVDGKIKIVK